MDIGWATALINWVNYEYPGCGYGFGVLVYSGHKAGLTALKDLGFENVESVLDFDWLLRDLKLK